MAIGKLDSKLEKAAKSFGKASKASEEMGGGSTEWEDGRYALEVSNAVINESKNSGRLQITFTFTGLEGEMKGQKKWDHVGIENEEQQARFFAFSIKKLGWEAPETAAEMKAMVARLNKEKPKIQGQLITNGEFQNVRWLRKLDAAAVADSADESEEVASESGEEETVTLEIGSKIEATLNSGEKVQGVVLEILEAEGKVRFETEEGKKYKVSDSKISILAGEESEEVPAEPEQEAEEESEEEEEETKPKVTKKTSTLKKKR